jgi:hypothetical protein
VSCNLALTLLGPGSRIHTLYGNRYRIKREISTRSPSLWEMARMLGTVLISLNRGTVQRRTIRSSVFHASKKQHLFCRCSCFRHAISGSRPYDRMQPRQLVLGFFISSVPKVRLSIKTRRRGKSGGGIVLHMFRIFCSFILLGSQSDSPNRWQFCLRIRINSIIGAPSSKTIIILIKKRDMSLNTNVILFNRIQIGRFGSLLESSMSSSSLIQGIKYLMLCVRCYLALIFRASIFMYLKYFEVKIYSWAMFTNSTTVSVRLLLGIPIPP